MMRIPTRIKTLAITSALLLSVACGDDGSTSTADPDAGTGSDIAVRQDTGPGGTAGPGSTSNAPSLARIGDKRAVVGQTLLIELRATDPNGDPLDYSVFGDLPPEAKFDKDDARFSWTPESGDLGSEWLLTFQVSDGRFEDRETIAISVVASADNSPPEFVDPGDQLLAVNQEYTLLLEATDPDGNELEFRVIGSIPEAASFDTTKGILVWTPSAADEDRGYRVLFEVSDGALTDDLFVNFRVGTATIAISELDPIVVQLGEPVSFALDIDNPAERTVTCSVVGALPAGAAFDAASCQFDWTPTDPELVGRAVQIVFQVTDGETTLVETVTVTIRATPIACTPDSYDIRESGGEQVVVTAGTLTDLAFCAGDFDDWHLDLEQGQQLTVRIDFEHDEADLDLALFAPGEDETNTLSNGVTDSETLAVAEIGTTGRWVVEVYSEFESSTTYDLIIEIEEMGNGCEDDDFEDNDNRDAAKPVSVGQSTAAVYCLADHDWYTFSAQAGQRIQVDLDGGGVVDLDVEIYAPGADVSEWFGISSGAVETVIVDAAPATGTYALRVRSFQAASGNYTLRVDVTGEMCQPDAPDLTTGGDDDAQHATFMEEGQTVAALTLCDPDWFYFCAPAGAEALVVIEYTTASFPTPPVVVLTQHEMATPLGEVSTDQSGVSILLESAPAADEEFYFLSIVHAEGAPLGMPYSVGLIVDPKCQ